MPAPVQITAEQLLREAKERELELVQPVFFSYFDLSKGIFSSTVNFLFVLWPLHIFCC